MYKKFLLHFETSVNFGKSKKVQNSLPEKLMLSVRDKNSPLVLFLIDSKM